ncbi:MAG: hypothetical protein JST93_19260 [Acidobacteria bacterium]|nr:hypothetical protein [Acidobacteriota bacterium]
MNCKDTGKNELPVRLFVLDERTAKPLPGVIVGLEEVGGPAGSRRRLGTLQTDAAGYVSFRIGKPRSGKVLVSLNAQKPAELTLDVTSEAMLNSAHMVRVSPTDLDDLDSPVTLPAIVRPDLVDKMISPASVGFVPNSGKGLCTQLVPSSFTTQEFEAFQVIANTCQPTDQACEGRLPVVAGRMLTYSVRWTPAGYSIGSLLNTVPLAPCEQVSVSIAGWQRREVASLDSSKMENVFEWQASDRNQLLNETMNLASKQKTSAWQIAATGKSNQNISGSGENKTSISPADWLASELPIKFTSDITSKLSYAHDLTGILGGGFSATKNSTDIAAGTTQVFSERIRQEAGQVASARSTVVFQSAVNETRTFQGRTIRNNNHCHTLTLNYYQIDQNYEVTTSYLGERPVLLLPFDSAVVFDAAKAYRYSQVLRDALLDESLDSCFDGLAEYLFCGKKKSVKTLRFFATNLFSDGPFGMKSKVFTVTLKLTDGTVLGPFQVQTLDLSAGEKFWFEVSLDTPIRRDELATITLASFGGAVQGLNVDLGGEAITLADGLLPLSPNGTSFPLPVSPNSEAGNCCIQKLVGHLNTHSRYYSTLIAMAESRDERIARWACCRLSDGSYLLDHIDLTPLTVFGNHLVYAAGEINPPDEPVESTHMTTLPTPGVHCEGILGRCGTCEKIDESTNWNWTDCGCKDEAPAPSPSTDGGVTKVGDLKDMVTTAFAALGIKELADAPASTLSSVLSELIKKAELSPSDAKDLLQKLLEDQKALVDAKG